MRRRRRKGANLQACQLQPNAHQLAPALLSAAHSVSHSHLGRSHHRSPDRGSMVVLHAASTDPSALSEDALSVEGERMGQELLAVESGGVLFPEEGALYVD